MERTTATASTRFEPQTRDSVLRPLHRPAQHRPGLDVSLVASVAGHPEARCPIVIARVSGGQGPVRLHMYVDGDLAETWSPGPAAAELDARKLRLGRHVVTARAVDASGRWGGASIVVEIVEPPSR